MRLIPDEPDDFDVVAQPSTTDVDLADFLGEDARFGVGLRVPDCRLTWALGEDGYLDTLWLLAPDWWLRSGRPRRNRYGVTVTADRQSVWLDDPSNPVL